MAPLDSAFLQWRPGQKQAFLAESGEANHRFGLVAGAFDGEDHPFTELSVANIVSGSEADGIGTARGGRGRLE